MVGNLMRRFFGSSGDKPAKMNHADVQHIVNMYGKILAEPAGIVRDITTLPFSKQQIKTALRFAISVTSEAAMRMHQKTAYLSLADFQLLTEHQKQCLREWNTVVSTDSNIATDSDLEKAAKKVSESGNEIVALNKAVAAESVSLQRELEAHGLWQD